MILAFRRACGKRSYRFQGGCGQTGISIESHVLAGILTAGNVRCYFFPRNWYWVTGDA
jgi:hypothetical protein